MKLRVLPVVFSGIDWTSRAKLGLSPSPTPRERAEERLPSLQAALPQAEFLDLCEVKSAEEAGRLVEASREADAVLTLGSELLVVKTAARALASAAKPVVFMGEENRPTPPLCDIYGCLKADGCEVYMTIDSPDLETVFRALRGKKLLANTKAVLIGDGYPSHSQVANPESADIVQQKLGVQIAQVEMEEFRSLWESADEASAEAQAQAWLDGAESVAQEARRDIVQCAKMYLAMKSLVERTGARALTIDCRAWDLWSCETFDAFYSPCMGLTTLRWEGVAAACEADICAMLSMCWLCGLSDRPAFLGNIGRVDRERGAVGVGGHAACTVNMNGEKRPLCGYRLTDYGGRGGVASYLPIEAGQEITLARLDKNLNRISLAAGRTAATERGFEVILSDADDFIHRCLTGDHYVIVLGNWLKEAELLADMLQIEVLTPACS